MHDKIIKGPDTNYKNYLDNLTDVTKNQKVSQNFGQFKVNLDQLAILIDISKSAARNMPKTSFGLIDLF